MTATCSHNILLKYSRGNLRGAPEIHIWFTCRGMTVSLSSSGDFLRENASSRSVSSVRSRDDLLLSGRAFAFVPRAYVVRQGHQSVRAGHDDGFSPSRFPGRRISENVTYVGTVSGRILGLTLPTRSPLTNSRYRHASDFKGLEKILYCCQIFYV